MVTLWNQTELCFVYGLHFPSLYQVPKEWLQVGKISDIFRGTNLFMPSIA